MAGFSQKRTNLFFDCCVSSNLCKGIQIEASGLEFETFGKPLVVCLEIFFLQTKSDINTITDNVSVKRLANYLVHLTVWKESTFRN